jgi:hypothetical protein
MPLWQLEPLDDLAPDWQSSSYRGKVIVRARDEADARDAAERAFGVKTRFALGRGIIAPPWKRSTLVSARVIEDPLYEVDGSTEVLYPPQP